MTAFVDAGVELVVFAIFCLIGLTLERMNPAERSFDGPGVRLNYVIGYFFLVGQELASIAMGVVLARSWHGLVALGSDGGSLGKAILFALPWLAARDFFYYWFHRLQHRSPWFWAQHALHHSEENLNATTTVRHHWLEMPLTAIFVYFPLALLFKPPATTYPIVAVVVSWLGLTNHLNLRFGLGRFSWIVSTPQNHRIHHSRRPEHQDKNFAAYFPVWDLLFGTYYRPAPAEYPETGLSSGERVTSTWQALVLPFSMWRRMLSRKDPLDRLPVRTEPEL